MHINKLTISRLQSFQQLSLPKEKVVQIKSEAIRLMDQDLVSARELAQLIGKMSAAILTVYPAPLHYRSLQALKHKALAASGYEVSPDAREDLLWWANNFDGMKWPYNDKGHPTVDNRSRCILKWMGSILPRRSNRRMLEQRRTEPAYQRSGDASHFICLKSFPAGQRRSLSPDPNR